jgi:cytochrome c-type biogenesis protein CcmF
VTSDFSVGWSRSNSHSDKPMIYKITGVWGNHEGSMLLWVLILTLFGAMAAWFGGNLPPTLRARVLAVQASIGVGLHGLHPLHLEPVPAARRAALNGQDLNPLLQDPGLAFHPPFLYLGYVGLSMAFSFAVAALIEGRVDAAWGRWVRPWTLAAWVFLTIGIALGSWWAYYELGWGGFWFWDPVENASFMPWLLSAALLHSAIVVEKREALKSWTILLAILAFGFSLIGTFIVRSGVLTSVHAFANDPERGVFILASRRFFTGGALTLFAWRAARWRPRACSAVSRESALVPTTCCSRCRASWSSSARSGRWWPRWPSTASSRSARPSSTWPSRPSWWRWPRSCRWARCCRGSAGDAARAMLAAVGRAGAGAGARRAGLGDADRQQRAWPGGRPAGPSGWWAGARWTSGRAGRAAAPTGCARLRRLPRADWGKATAHIGHGRHRLRHRGAARLGDEDIRVAQLGDRFDSRASPSRCN